MYKVKFTCRIFFLGLFEKETSIDTIHLPGRGKQLEEEIKLLPIEINGEFQENAAAWAPPPEGLTSLFIGLGCSQGPWAWFFCFFVFFSSSFDSNVQSR